MTALLRQIRHLAGDLDRLLDAIIPLDALDWQWSMPEACGSEADLDIQQNLS